MAHTRDPLAPRAAGLLLTVVAACSGWAALIHQLSPEPDVVDVVAGSTAFLYHAILLVYLKLRPDRATQIIWMSVLFILVAATCVTWHFVAQATLSNTIALVDTFPPIAPVLLLLTTTVPTTHTLNRREAAIAAIAAWICIALPVLLYLIYHLNELFSARGIELLLTLGPLMLFALVIIEFNTAVDRKIVRLQGERQHMEALADRDVLTDLYNRRGIEKIFRSLGTEAQTAWGIILFDIDRFKTINDRYGHDIGDAVLSQVAQRCRTSLRSDDWTARWGGEEFLILIQNANVSGLLTVAENLRAAISRDPIAPVGRVTASFGITISQPDDSIDSLIKRADNAMYAAKQQGRDRVVRL